MEICFYVHEPVERQILEPIAAALGEMGYATILTEDLTQPSEVGVYACHPNSFFNTKTGLWDALPSKISVICAHDFAQAGNAGPAYFIQDGWHLFDLGLVPGPTLRELGNLAHNLGYRLPTHGLHEVGWPPSDVAIQGGVRIVRRVEQLRNELGLTNEKVLLLACSWSSPVHLEELLGAIDQLNVAVILRVPPYRPPRDDDPWRSRLLRAAADGALARTRALGLPNVLVPDSTTSLYDLLRLSDVVVSNGSTVLYEGLLMGKPGVSVTSWLHPAGSDGTASASPVVNCLGVVEGPIENLHEMLKTALSAHMQPYVQQGRASLVPHHTLGTSVQTAADRIEELLHYNQAAVNKRRRIRLPRRSRLTF